MADNTYGLNEKQLAFCDYYLRNLNAGEAYRMAYDPNGEKNLKQGSCYTNGSRLLKKEKIQNYLNIRREEIKTDRIMEVEEILAELNEIATDPAVKTSDKIRALELLGKHKAMFTDKMSMDSDVEINLVGIEEGKPKEIVEAEYEKIEENS